MRVASWRFLLAMGMAIMGMMPMPVVAGTDTFHRTYWWHFEGKGYVMEYDIPWETYHFYQEKQRVFHNYAVYAYENPDYAFLPDFVDRLSCIAEEAGLNRDQTLRLVIAFVQQLQYQPEKGEYPKFPIETLAERGGDCEDTSILLSAMLRLMGYSSVMVNPPGHMAVAIACDDCQGTAYNQDGRRYYYVETTAAGYSIGDIPEDYRTTTDKVHAMKVRKEDLWVLNAFVPQRTSGMVYFVSEDAGTHTAKLQSGESIKTSGTLKTVNVDGKVFITKRR